MWSRSRGVGFQNCWSRSRFFKTAGVGVRGRSRNICCNYRLQCLLNNLNYNINCLKMITGYWQYIVFWMTISARAHWPLCLATGGRVFVADPRTLGRHACYVCKRSVCGGDEPQPVAHLSHKLQCARQSLKIMVSYGNKYPRHKNAATCG